MYTCRVACLFLYRDYLLDKGRISKDYLLDEGRLSNNIDIKEQYSSSVEPQPQLIPFVELSSFAVEENYKVLRHELEYQSTNVQTENNFLANSQTLMSTKMN